MSDAGPRYSRSIEDYLKAILTIAHHEGTASTSALARALEVQPSSVTGMVKKLAESELLEHVPYRGVRLTEKGERTALRILRRHRILETYLTERLGYGWDEVHVEAETLEHAVSDRLIERMAEALGDPEHDPHGAPIPSPEGTIVRPAVESLAEAPLGIGRVVAAVRDDDADHLLRMESCGIKPGVRVELLIRGSDSADYRVRVGSSPGREESLPDRIARRIFVGVGE